MHNLRRLERLLQQPRFSDSNVQYKVKLLVDPTIEQYYPRGSHWHERLAAGQLRIRYDFCENFGISLDFIEALSWDYNYPTLHHAIRAAEKISLGDADLVVGITRTQDQRHAGLAKLGGRYGIISIHDAWILTELHELGHLFHAGHVDEVMSYMYKESNSRRQRWDEKSKATILKNKYHFHHKPL